MRPVSHSLPVVLTVLLLTNMAFAQQSLTIQDTDVLGLSASSMNITMDTTDGVQGFVLAIGYDDMMVTATDISPSGDASSAELIVPEILSGGATLGVVMQVQGLRSQPWR